MAAFKLYVSSLFVVAVLYSFVPPFFYGVHSAIFRNLFHLNFYISIFYWASLVAQMVKNPPAIWDTWVRSLSWEDLLEKGMPTHSSIMTWKIPWTEEPGRIQSMGSSFNSSNFFY